MFVSKKFIGFACVGMLAVAGCKNGGDTAGDKGGMDKGAGGDAVAAGPMGTVLATVKFTGTPPKMAKLKREADPVCAKTEMVEQTVVVNDGMLANVMVRAKGLKGPAPKEPAQIDQVDCMYTPRVVGMVKGQELEVKNSDSTGHNVHTYKGDETLFNRAQPQPGTFTKKSSDLTEPNGPAKFKCDIHPWMTGYVFVNAGPYFGVSGNDGQAKFELPVGTHTLEAWHELYGTKTAEVTVEEGKDAEVTFEFDGTEKTES